MITCTACTKPLSARANTRTKRGLPITGLCGACYLASTRVERKCRDCGAKVTCSSKARCRPCANRVTAANPELEARRIAAAVRARKTPEAQARCVAGNRARAQRQLAWLPDEYRTEYERLRGRCGAAEAKARIWAKMTPFERQLARVREGARVVAKPAVPVRGHEFSLVGNASAMVAA